VELDYSRDEEEKKHGEYNLPRGGIVNESQDDSPKEISSF
jgi:hypothetical protein